MRILLLALFLLLVSSGVWGQEVVTKEEVTDIVAKALQKQDEKIKKGQDELLEKLQAINDSDKTTIGTFRINEYATVVKNGTDFSFERFVEIRNNFDKKLKDQHVKKEYKERGIVSGDNNMYTFIQIDSVRIWINEGVIESIKVYTIDGAAYSNRKAPIPILTLENRFSDKLHNPYNNNYILLKDVLSFESIRRFNYFPDEQELLLFNKDKNGNCKSSVKLEADNNINSLLNIGIYSDLMALFGNEANGLVQLEASSKFYLHRHNYKNSFIYVPLDVIEPFFHFSRIDSKFDTITLSNKDEINRLELFRRSTYTVGLDANIFRWDFRPSNSLEIKAGYMLSTGNIVIKDDKTSYSIHSPYGEIAVKSKKLNNFGIDLKYRYLFQKLNPNKLIENDEWNQLMSFTASVFYFPNKKKDNKFFIRFINYLNLSDRKQDFSQLQFGYQQALNF